jgi:Zn-dependent protease with chaperone function/fibronectin type 3 domain-containing protein
MANGGIYFMVVNSQTRFAIALALVLLLVAAPCASASVLKLSRNDELKIGKDFYASYSKEHKYLDTTREGVLVKKIGARLVQRNAVKDWDFVFTLVDDKDVNAFAVPGGYVFINKGLYDYVAYDEAMLAAVLGHEMSHVRERHYKKMYDKAITAQIGLAVAGLVIGGDQGQDVANVLGLGSSLVFLKYSRDEEEQADRDGIELAFKAGYDPYGMTRNMRLFQKLESKLGQDELFDLWRTHPQPAERIARCESIAKELSGKTESSYHPPSPPAGYDYGNTGSSNPDLLAPAVVVATDGTYADRIRITWKPSKGASNYIIYRASSQDGNFTQIGQSGSTSYDDYINDGGTYWYMVRASNSSGYSEYSSADSGYPGNGNGNGSGSVKPGLPSSIVASDGTYADFVRIKWAASSNAAFYNIYRATDLNGNYINVGKTSSTTFDDAVPSYKVFWYKVRAVNAKGASAFTDANSGFRGKAGQPGTQTKVPSPPSSVAASDGSYADMVRVTWTASTGATSYKIYRATSQGANYTYIGQISTNFYEDYVNDDNVYWYKVRAINSYGGSGYSNADSGYMGNGTQTQRLSPPGNVAASDGEYTDVVSITWTASSGATNYKVYRATSENGSYSYIGQSSSSPYDDYDSDTYTFWYKVKASNSSGDSEYSSADSGYKSTGPQLPEIPLNLSASDGTYPDMVRVTWTASTGATSYKVYRATSKTGTYTLLGQTSSSTYEDYVNDMNFYWYKVIAVNAFGNSGYSNVDRGFKK